MITKETLLLVTFCFLVPTAGCIGTIPGEGAHIGFHGDMRASESGFQMNGDVAVGGGTTDQSYFDNVTVELYTANGELIHRESLGRLNGSYGSVNVSIITSKQPEHVLLMSPDFWIESVDEVEYYERMNETHYEVEEATSKSDLPRAVRERNGNIVTDPMNGRYYAFSIKEVSTVSV